MNRSRKMERDVSVDILRAIALLGVILIHISPSPFFCQLRDFDVPLFVFLAGVVLAKKGNPFPDRNSIVKYYKDRLIRILIPIYIYLILCLLCVSLLSPGSLNIVKVLPVFALYTHWYVWIFRVLLLLAFLSPVLIKMTLNQSLGVISVACGFVLTFMEIFNAVVFVDKDAWYYYLVELIPYICVYVLGIVSERINKKGWLIIAGIGALIYILIAVWLYRKNGIYIQTRTSKYPPTMYYISYACMCIGVLWILRHKIVVLTNYLPQMKSFFLFIGSHTMWIYLWHILLLNICGFVLNPIWNHMSNLRMSFWIVRYIFVLGGAILITMLQSYIAHRISYRINNQEIRKCFCKIFIG